MATAFLGYVLPWGQMSFWGATVITNLASAIPIVGKSVAYWLWGGFSVDNATLVRFYSLHFLLPFLIAGLTILHISLLHSHGSSIALGVEDPIDFIPFYPYFLIKDVFGFFIFLFVFVFLVFFEPNLLGHPDNYIRANALVTPKHIVPEWYFLPFYAILRAVPSKLGGVVAMAASIGILFFMPLLSKSRSKKSNKTFFSLFFDLLCWIWSVDPTTRIKAPECRFYFTFFFSFFVLSFILLGVLGAKPIEYPYTGLSVVIGAYYFFFLIFADKF
jgi:ubiquinol-cytochrome c reductase cytochrome b subunit